MRFILGGETYAFADGCNFVYFMRHDLKRVIGRKLPLTMITESEQLFKAIIKSTTTTEKILMIDVEAAREAYNDEEISDVVWMLGKNNTADGLT